MSAPDEHCQTHDIARCTICAPSLPPGRPSVMTQLTPVEPIPTALTTLESRYDPRR